MGHLQTAFLGRAERFLRRHHAGLLYHSKVGVKALNPTYDADYIRRARGPAPVALPAQDLLLSVDGLNDDHALTGMTVAQSPHARLMEDLLAGRPVEDSDYVRRCEAGTIDFRRPRSMPTPALRRLEDRFKSAWAEAEAGRQPPILVLRMGGQNFIADGKHRAAVQALRGTTIQCIDVTGWVADSFMARIASLMHERPARYTRNLAVLDVLLDSPWQAPQ